MFVIYHFSYIIMILYFVLDFNPEKVRNVCHYVTFLDVTSSCFPSLVQCLKFTLHNVATKTGNQRKPHFK